MVDREGLNAAREALGRLGHSLGHSLGHRDAKITQAGAWVMLGYTQTDSTETPIEGPGRPARGQNRGGLGHFRVLGHFWVGEKIEAQN